MSTRKDLLANLKRINSYGSYEYIQKFRETHDEYETALGSNEVYISLQKLGLHLIFDSSGPLMDYLKTNYSSYIVLFSQLLHIRGQFEKLLASVTTFQQARLNNERIFPVYIRFKTQQTLQANSSPPPDTIPSVYHRARPC